MSKKKSQLSDPDYMYVPYMCMDMEPADRFVLATIYLLTNGKEKRCVASNEYIGKIAKVGTVSVGNSLLRLEKRGFIKRLFSDTKKRNRQEILYLIGLKVIPSTDLTKEDLVPSTGGTLVQSTDGQNNISINNISSSKEEEEATEAVVPNTPFNSKLELEKLTEYKTKWLQIIGAFAIKKGLTFTSKKQINQLTARFSKVAKRLSDFDVKKIKSAMQYCSEMKDKEGHPINWSLETVEKQLLTNPNL